MDLTYASSFEQIKYANSLPLLSILAHYGVYLDESNRKIGCPFPSHKNGKEQTPSFVYYHNTNTFWCFGCKIFEFFIKFTYFIF